MAFEIIKKFKPDKIKNRNLDTGFLDKYYKNLQQLLIQKTNLTSKTDYFFCEDFAVGEHLLVLGNQTENHKKVFKNAGKGKDGFDKTKISMGTCFILDEKGKKILCIEANTTLAKGKKNDVMKALNKMRRAHMKQINDVRWLTSPLMANAQDPSVIEVVEEEQTSTGSNNSDQPVVINKGEIVQKAKNLKKGIQKLVKDVIPRFKKREATTNDAAFVKALRKAGLLFLTNLTQTEPGLDEKFSSHKEILENSLPQWKTLESRIHSQKTKKETTAAQKQSLKKVVDQMNVTRAEIKTILKRINLKKLN